jgi:hypothetical protein
MKNNKWSVSAIKFLKDNYKTLTDEELSNGLNQKYGMHTNVVKVQKKRHRLGYIKPQTFRWRDSDIG